MLIKNFFRSVGEKMGWEYTDISVSGEKCGVMVNFGQMGFCRVIEFDFDVLNKNTDILISHLLDNKSSLKISSVMKKENGIVVFSNEFWSVVNFERFKRILEFTIAELVKLGISPEKQEFR